MSSIPAGKNNRPGGSPSRRATVLLACVTLSRQRVTNLTISSDIIFSLISAMLDSLLSRSGGVGHWAAMQFYSVAMTMGNYHQGRRRCDGRLVRIAYSGVHSNGRSSPIALLEDSAGRAVQALGTASGWGSERSSPPSGCHTPTRNLLLLNASVVAVFGGIVAARATRGAYCCCRRYPPHWPLCPP